SALYFIFFSSCKVFFTLYLSLTLYTRKISVISFNKKSIFLSFFLLFRKTHRKILFIIVSGFTAIFCKAADIRSYLLSRLKHQIERIFYENCIRKKFYFL